MHAELLARLVNQPLGNWITWAELGVQRDSFLERLDYQRIERGVVVSDLYKNARKTEYSSKLTNVYLVKPSR